MSRRSRAGVRLAASVLAIAVAAGCSTTVDESMTSETTDAVDSTVASSLPPNASPAVVLAAMAADLSKLSNAVVDEHGDDELLASIEAQWAAVRAKVADQRPELVDRIDTTVAMARSAVDRRRPADADKAFKLLDDIADDIADD